MKEIEAVIHRITGAHSETLGRKLQRGAVAGLIGTVAMTPVIGIGAIGGWKRPSPAQITANAERKSGADKTPHNDAGFTPQWLAAHLSFGTGWGAAYAIARPWLPASAVAAGLLWGGAIWVINYGVILPALGLYPSPADDDKGRLIAVVAAHGVYGVTVAKSAQILRD